jgi:hypothetical protein
MHLACSTVQKQAGSLLYFASEFQEFLHCFAKHGRIDVDVCPEL